MGLISDLLTKIRTKSMSDESQDSDFLDKSEDNQVFYRVSFEAASLGLSVPADKSMYKVVKPTPEVISEVQRFITKLGISSDVKSISSMGYGDISLMVDNKADAIRVAKILDKNLKKASAPYLAITGNGDPEHNCSIEFPVSVYGAATQENMEYIPIE